MQMPESKLRLRELIEELETELANMDVIDRQERPQYNAALVVTLRKAQMKLDEMKTVRGRFFERGRGWRTPG